MKRKIPETYEQDSRSVTYGPHTIGITVHTIRSIRGRRLHPYETISTLADDCVLVWSPSAFIVAVRVTGVATVCIVSAVKRTGAAVEIAYNANAPHAGGRDLEFDASWRAEAAIATPRACQPVVWN